MVEKVAPKVKCFECYWYEPSADAQQGMCLFEPPKPLPMQVQTPPSPIARAGAPSFPQMQHATAGIVPPAQANGRCRYHSELQDIFSVRVHQ
jgi:hypothetical protein